MQPRSVHNTDPLAQERLVVQREESARAEGFFGGLFVGGAGALMGAAALIGLVRLASVLLS